MSSNFSHAYMLVFGTNCTLMYLCVCVYILLHGWWFERKVSDDWEPPGMAHSKLRHVHCNMSRQKHGDGDLTMPASTTAAAAIIYQRLYAVN